MIHQKHQDKLRNSVANDKYTYLLFMARIDELNQDEQISEKNQVKYNLADMVVPVF